MVKISYIEITARVNYPTEGQPQLHLWEPTLQTLSTQTFKDFEYIVVDVFYEERPDYFKTHNYGLQIKHVPAAPNIWHELGMVQTCHQFNKGIIHADGELIFTGADSAMYPPDLMENLWCHYKNGYFVSLGFGADLTYVTKLKKDEWQGMALPDAPTQIVPTSWYDFGYNGFVVMDHRFRSLFENNEKQNSTIPPEWYYGISTVSLEAALKINGYDEAFDGDSTLNDVDFGTRLAMAGYNNITMFRDSYTVEAYAKLWPQSWHPKMKRPEIKCNNGILLYNKVTGKYRANQPLYLDIDYIINTVCKRICPIRDKCATLPHRGPFYNKNEKKLFEYWREHGATFQMDLEFEREMRIDKDDYLEGTYVNVQ